MADLSKVTIGACQVQHKNVDLGHTLEGVEFTFERETQELTVDKYGNSTVDKAIIGQKVMAKFKLAEFDQDRLNTAIPEADHDLGGEGERLNLGTQAGYLLKQDAGLLRLRPWRNVASGDDSEDVHIYKAVSVENIELPYKVDEQRVIEVTMEGFIDETYGDGRLLGHIGPEDIS